MLVSQKETKGLKYLNMTSLSFTNKLKRKFKIKRKKRG